MQSIYNQHPLTDQLSGQSLPSSFISLHCCLKKLHPFISLLIDDRISANFSSKFILDHMIHRKTFPLRRLERLSTFHNKTIQTGLTGRYSLQNIFDCIHGHKQYIFKWNRNVSIFCSYFRFKLQIDRPNYILRRSKPKIFMRNYDAGEFCCRIFLSHPESINTFLALLDTFDKAAS